MQSIESRMNERWCIIQAGKQVVDKPNVIRLNKKDYYDYKVSRFAYGGTELKYQGVPVEESEVNCFI